MNMLSPENLNQLVSNNFLQYIINEIKLQGKAFFTGIDNLKRFISFLYFVNKKDPFQEIFAEFFNHEMIQNFLEGKITFQMQEISLIDQNQNIKDDEIKKYDQDLETDVNDIQNNQEQEDSEYDKEQYFQQLEKEKKQIPNPVQEVSQILQKYSQLKVEEYWMPFKVNADSQIQYQYKYKCIGMQIQPFISNPLNTKQDAKTQAARLLYPHLKYYDRYREPYQMHLYNDQEQYEEQMCEEEFYYTQFEDAFIYKQIYEEGTNAITEVSEILQKQDNKSDLFYIREDYSRQDNGIMLCKATFMASEKIVSQGFGLNKKMAKEIAFFKLIKDIKKYFYELNGSYACEFMQQPKRNYRRRNRNNDDDNQDQ
ncbi:hypothetical protein ABPG72_004446 [Tetrahymena utriculariae]